MMIFFFFLIVCSTTTIVAYPCPFNKHSVVPCPRLDFVERFYHAGAFSMIHAKGGDLSNQYFDFLSQYGVVGLDWDSDLSKVGYFNRSKTLARQSESLKMLAAKRKKTILTFVYRFQYSFDLYELKNCLIFCFFRLIDR
jgi:hypothetical protein